MKTILTTISVFALMSAIPTSSGEKQNDIENQSAVILQTSQGASTSLGTDNKIVIWP